MELILSGVIVLLLIVIIYLLVHDDELSSEEPSAVKIVLRPKVLVLEPWRDSVFAPETILVSTGGIFKIADPTQLQKILVNESTYINDLAESLRAHGVQQPLVVVLDTCGSVVLMDGYHRLVAAQQARIDLLPVRVLPSEKIKGYKCSVLAVLEVHDVPSCSGPG